MDELSIDYKADDFTEQKMIEQFKLKSEDDTLHFWERNRFKDLISILGAHKFWETEPIMLFRHKIKEGEIKQIKPTDVP